MRFSLQDVRKSVRRSGGELAVHLHFLRSGELSTEIGHFIAYYEGMLGKPQRVFAADEARAYIGEYRLANCLMAVLSHWYSWRSREWAVVVSEYAGTAELLALASPVQLRLALYNYVNEHYGGFLTSVKRTQALQMFAQQYAITVEQLDYLLLLDNDEEAILTCVNEPRPTPQDVTTLYNQWVFEAALFNASNVRFVIDCAAFAQAETLVQPSTVFAPALGLGAVIKRLCFLARQLGVYYDLEYEATLLDTHGPERLILTLYGPQEVTGAPQQYGLRLARLCRVLMGYSSARSVARSGKKPQLSSGIVEAEARVHFLQRAYTFTMSPDLLQLLPTVAAPTASLDTNAVQLFDSSIEQSFSEAFASLMRNQAADGWMLEREPEPLLTNKGIVIPDFAVTRGKRRIYVEILGYWTPAYRERKIQKLQLLQEREDLLLAIPIEAKEAFASIAMHFPIVYYHNQLSASELLQLLRTTYDDFAERLATVDLDLVRSLLIQDGFIPESLCYTLFQCYRRSELQQAATYVCRELNGTEAFVPGLGLYDQTWLIRFKELFISWFPQQQTTLLHDVIQLVKAHWSELTNCEDTAIEVLLELLPEVAIQRDSIFDATIVLTATSTQQTEQASHDQVSTSIEDSPSHEERSVVAKKPTRERKSAKKRTVKEAEIVQGDLWG